MEPAAPSDSMEREFLTNMIKSNPIGGIHFFFNVPENNEVLTLAQGVFVHACSQAGAALRSHKVGVAVGSLQVHVLRHGALRRQALEVLWTQSVP